MITIVVLVLVNLENKIMIEIHNKIKYDDNINVLSYFRKK